MAVRFPVRLPAVVLAAVQLVEDFERDVNLDAERKRLDLSGGGRGGFVPLAASIKRVTNSPWLSFCEVQRT
jgi:hypothetical protein